MLSSMKEIDVEVGPVNHRMATSAIAARLKAEAAMRDIGGNGIDMAGETQEPFFPPHQKHSVHTAMRRVADDAALHFDSGVLEHKWAAFFGVTLDAGLPSGLAQGSSIGGAVGIVAIRAFYCAFRNAVVCRQRKLGHNISVTSGA